MKPVILLVEDNREILDFIETNLCDTYTVKKTINGQAALDVLRNEVIDLIVSDVMMPVMDGFELCRIIKSDVELSHLPCILLTAKNTLKARLQGLELGADVYIEKPFSPKHLKMQIASLLANRNKIKDYFANSPIAQLKSIAHTKADEKFLENVNHIIEEHLQEQELDVDRLARYLNMSRTTFYRKISAISDLTPNDLINLTRLKKAAKLMSEGYNINEVSDIVGYNSPKIFSKNFEKQFGMVPSEYIGKHLKK
ncbi:response regulator transcription factor [Niabella ginsengisoli]|uniref:Response regulator n=1 Tax=Niabella ginsengisoli TaxID=522298 RepID=A0ABS9SDL8_9BACT|nr:response regulator [Niabella ginsengisoli]MCH5596457.1 response regulator [Niabella ginsengisoli]